MKTHTIRWNLDKTKRIITFTPVFFKLLRTKHSDAVSVVLYILIKHLKSETGKDHIINHEQLSILEKNMINLKLSYELHIIEKWFISGIRILDTSLDQILNICDVFYNMLENKNKG